MAPASARKAAAIGRGPDAVAMLKADHKQVKDWFEEFEKSRVARAFWAIERPAFPRRFRMLKGTSGAPVAPVVRAIPIFAVCGDCFTQLW